MEQQTQQPSQQEQPSPSSSKNFLANPKLPLIAAIIAITLSVGGILLLQAMQPASPAAGPAPAAQTPQTQQQTAVPYTQPTEIPPARERYLADIVQEYCRGFGEVAESIENKPRYMRLEDLPVKIDPEVAVKIVSSRKSITPSKDYPVVCSSYENKYTLGVEGDNFTYLSITTTLSPDKAKKVIKESDYGNVALVYENVGTDAPESEFIFVYGEKSFKLNKDETLYVTFSVRLFGERHPRFEEIKETILNKNSPMFNNALYAQLSQTSPEKDTLTFVEQVLGGITIKSNLLDQTQTVDTSTWQTYRSDEFGFEVRYPKEFVVKENLKYVEGVIQEYGFPVDVLVGFPDSAYANSLTHGALHINRIVNPEINCMGFEYSQSPPVVKIINGVSFTETSYGDGAMARSDDRKRYNTMHRGICYQIERVIVTINYYKELGGEWVDPKEVEKKLDQILGTFRFVE